MANIKNHLNNIKNAMFGKDVRNSIHDAIKQCYDDASVNNDNANMEVKLARGVHNTLNDRLSESDKKQKELSSQLEHIRNEKASLQQCKEEIAKAQLEGAGVDTTNFVVQSELSVLEEEMGITLKRYKNLFEGDFKNAYIGTYTGSLPKSTSNIQIPPYKTRTFEKGIYFCVINFDLNFNEAITGTANFNLKGSGFNNNTDLSQGGEIPYRVSLSQNNENITVSLVTEFTETKDAYLAISIVGAGASSTRTYEISIKNCAIIKVNDTNERYDDLIITNGFLDEYCLSSGESNIKQNSNRIDKNSNRIDKIETTLENLKNNVNITNIVDYIGDSLTRGDQDGTGVSRASIMQELLGSDWKVNNLGAGGEKSNTIVSRQGGMSLIVQPGVTIPSKGGVYIEILDDEANTINLRNSTVYEGLVNPCFIAGIEGKLSQTGTFGESPYLFTRTTEGENIVLNRPVRLVTNQMLKNKNNILIIWAGQNGGFNSDPIELVKQIKKAVKYNNTNKYLIIGLHTANKELINQALKDEFGNHFIDIKKYILTPLVNSSGEIISCYGLDDVNITPTNEDIENIKNNTIPTSLMCEGDITHFNRYGYEVIAKLEYKTGQGFGWW